MVEWHLLKREHGYRLPFATARQIELPPSPRQRWKQLYADTCGVLSMQVLQEYCNVALKKFKLPAHHVSAQLELYEQFEVIHATPAIIHAALELHQMRGVEFFDAIILASAQTAGCSLLMTEDMNESETIGGLRIANPFVINQTATVLLTVVQNNLRGFILDSIRRYSQCDARHINWICTLENHFGAAILHRCILKRRL